MDDLLGQFFISHLRCAYISDAFTSHMEFSVPPSGIVQRPGGLSRAPPDTFYDKHPPGHSGRNYPASKAHCHVEIFDSEDVIPRVALLARSGSLRHRALHGTVFLAHKFNRGSGP